MDFLGDRFGDARHRFDVLDGGDGDCAGTAEMMQQRALSVGADAGDFVESRTGKLVGAARAMRARAESGASSANCTRHARRPPAPSAVDAAASSAGSEAVTPGVQMVLDKLIAPKGHARIEELTAADTPAMIDLAQTYEKAGLYLAPGELPDYLPAVLEFVSTQPPAEVRASPAAQRWFNRLITAWVPARLPELSRTMTRLPPRSNTVILQNLAKLSMPAFVRESEAKIIPLSSMTPMQYVMQFAWYALDSTVRNATCFWLRGRRAG